MEQPRNQVFFKYKRSESFILAWREIEMRIDFKTSCFGPRADGLSKCLGLITSEVMSKTKLYVDTLWGSEILLFLNGYTGYCLYGNWPSFHSPCFQFSQSVFSVSQSVFSFFTVRVFGFHSPCFRVYLPWKRTLFPNN